MRCLREGELARTAGLAQLVDRAGAVDDRDDHRAERRQRERGGQLVPDVGRMVRDGALGEYLVDDRERIRAPAEVGGPALRHAGRVERARDRDGPIPGRDEVVGEAVDDRVTPLAEPLGIASGSQALVRHSSAFSPVRSRPTISVWMSCVPS